MEPRKVESKKRYVLAFIIATVIFIAGFAITYSVAYFEYQRITNLQDPISYKIFQDKLKFTLFEKDICSEENFLEVSKDLAFQGSVIGTLEEKMGKDNKNILFRKKFYSLIQLEHFEMVKTINKECGKNTNTILFFYSNDKEDLANSEDLGALLGVLYQRNKENLVIYSFDINLESEIISLLKEKYSVTSPTKIILNEKYSFNKINNLNEIESLLN